MKAIGKHLNRFMVSRKINDFVEESRVGLKDCAVTYTVCLHVILQLQIVIISINEIINFDITALVFFKTYFYLQLPSGSLNALVPIKVVSRQYYSFCFFHCMLLLS